MATGFTNRFRGKIVAKEIWLAPPSTVAASTATLLNLDSFKILPTSSLAAIYILPPPQVGAQVTIATATCATAGTGTRVLWATTGSFFGTTNTTLTFSTAVPEAVTLYGVSTQVWIIAASTVAGPAGA